MYFDEANELIVEMTRKRKMDSIVVTASTSATMVLQRQKWHSFSRSQQRTMVQGLTLVPD
jgi:hypothetical protein